MIYICEESQAKSKKQKTTANKTTAKTKRKKVSEYAKLMYKSDKMISSTMI